MNFDLAVFGPARFAGISGLLPLILSLGLTPSIFAARFSLSHASFDGGGGIAWAGQYFADSAIESIAGSGHISFLNDPPSPEKDYLELPSTGNFSIPVVRLLANDSDLEGNVPLLSLLQTNTIHGGSVTLSNGVITYIAPRVPDIRGDSFRYALSDSSGGASVGTVVLFSPWSASRLVEIRRSPTNIVVRFQGPSNAVCMLQSRANLELGALWLDFPTADQPLVERADTSGYFQFTVPVSSDLRFFRAADVQSLNDVLGIARAGSRLSMTLRGIPNTTYKLQIRNRFDSFDSWHDYPGSAHPLIFRAARDGLYAFSTPVLENQAFFKAVPLDP